MGLQMDYDLDIAQDKLWEKFKAEVKPIDHALAV